MERREAEKAKKPKAVHFSDKMQKVVGLGEEHEILNQLIAEQDADSEPSPLDAEGENPRQYPEV